MFSKQRHWIVSKLAPKIYQEWLYKLDKSHRPSILAVKELGLKNIVGAEIGVRQGENAERILNLLDMKMLYCVDSYSAEKDTLGYPENQQLNKKIANSRLSWRKNVLQLHMFSSDAALKIKDKSLDFVYIDADHTYDAVCFDIFEWAQKVKKGGVVAGHDFSAIYLGVVWAVIEYCLDNCYDMAELHTSQVDWWFIKK